MALGLERGVEEIEGLFILLNSLQFDGAPKGIFGLLIVVVAHG